MTKSEASVIFNHQLCYPKLTVVVMVKKCVLLLLIASCSIEQLYAQEPTKEQTIEYLHAKILAFSNDSTLPNQLNFNPNECTLDMAFSSFTTTLYFSNCNANGISWNLDGNRVVLTIVAKQNHAALICNFTNHNVPIYSSSVVFRFSASKIAGDSDFQNQMTKAFDHLIGLCGGIKKNSPFK